MTIPFDELAALQPGDVIYECESGYNIRTRVVDPPLVTTDGCEDRRQVNWVGENTENGEKIAYLLTEGLEHYGPRLYRDPQYWTVRAGEPTYDLVGAKK